MLSAIDGYDGRKNHILCAAAGGNEISTCQSRYGFFRAGTSAGISVLSTRNMGVLFGGNFKYELNLFTQDVTKYIKIIAEMWDRYLMRIILGVHGSEQHASF